MTTKNNLSTSELAVLEHLSDTPQAISQREIARRSGLSVGMINAVLKKLVCTGYVKTSNLNRRSIQYLLTPQGFAEKARKSYRYVLDTVRRYRTIQVRFTGLMETLSSTGIREFYLHGEGDLADLVETLFAEESYGVLRRGLPEPHVESAIVLNAETGALADTPCRIVNLIDVLGNGSPSHVTTKGDAT